VAGPGSITASGAKECIVRVFITGQFVFKLVLFALAVGTIAGLAMTR
jgi:hypothetical protein